MKKTFLALTLALVFVLSLTLCVSAADANEDVVENGGEILFGDVNGDGEVNNVDALMILKYIFNSERYPLNIALADVDFDSTVTNADVLKIFRNIYNSELYPLPVDLTPRQGNSTYGYRDLAKNVHVYTKPLTPQDFQDLILQPLDMI